MEKGYTLPFTLLTVEKDTPSHPHLAGGERDTVHPHVHTVNCGLGINSPSPPHPGGGRGNIYTLISNAGIPEMLVWHRYFY